MNPGPLNNPEKVLRDLFGVAVAAADPAKCVPPHLDGLVPDDQEKTGGRIVVVGAGKASAAMARAVEDYWPEREISGLVVTRYGFAVACDRIEIVEAAHPVPDAAGLRAAERILAIAQELGPDDLLLCLISGGGSALLTLPGEGLALEDKQAVNAALLRSGATIGDMNCVRKHLSGIKGGRLAAAAAPARVVSLLISDVPGDDPGVIASGPTVPDETTLQNARDIVEKFAIELPDRVWAYLQNPDAETPKPGDAVFEITQTRLVARPLESLEAAAEKAKELGLHTVILGDALEGEARDVAREQAALARASTELPCLLLSGGELTVTIKGDGRGGPNTEFLVSLAAALDGAENIHAIACDTDGIDGSEDNAGAVIGPETVARAKAAGLNLAGLLENNDAYSFFEALDDLVISGPTLTNVNDFRAILVLS
ncbi:MAG: glycerate kinase [Rhodospirillales bacterium]